MGDRDERTEIQVDRDKAAAYVKSLADKYDTYGNHKYKTTSGRDVVAYGKYGWKINQTARQTPRGGSKSVPDNGARADLREPRCDPRWL